MLVELRPQKELLDPTFNGYKLSLDPIPVYRQSITHGVDQVFQNEDQYSFVHTKVFSLHSHLFADPWHDNTVFIVDSTWKVQKATVSTETGRVEELETVWRIPNLSNRVPGNFNTSLVFPGPESVMVSDGCGRLHVLTRQDHSQWQVEFTHEVDDCEGGCVLMSACLTADSSTLNCVLMSLKTLKTEEGLIAGTTNKPRPATVNTVLHWLTLSKDDEGVWSVLCNRRLEGAGSVEYVALEASSSAIYVVSNATFKFTADSANPLPPPTSDSMDTEEPLYTWEQTEDDVNVVMAVNKNTRHDDIDVVVTEGEITIRYQHQIVMSGILSHAIDKELTTWLLHSDRLEVTLVKREIGLMWTELIPGDTKGQHVLNPEVVGEVHSRLSHLCSDTEVQETGESYAPTFNLDQLEECDSAPEETCNIVRLDSTTHSVSHQISLAGHQWLTAIDQGPNNPPCVCVRHDVDGCVWKLNPPDTDWACQHIGTFCALGYVAASKQQRKFIIAAPDLSYAVICEAASHVFVYRKASIVDGELRNRKTSTKVATVAKQQLINLESQSPILGARATNTHLFVLTKETLYTFHIQ